MVMSNQTALAGDDVVESEHFLGENFRDGREPQNNDVFIAVMGVTGAGKSTFISQLAQRPVKIGRTLQACTQVVEVYACRFDQSRFIYLIDTPGFDDTNKSDTMVLKEIATWLTDSYSNEIKLNGIIYLHRISDLRMPGSAKKNLLMFKKLCGTNALKNVVLVTTMWDRTTLQDGAERENELKTNEDFWGWMISKGSRVERHANNRQSAMRLIGSFVDQGSKVTLELQHQMVNENKTLNETDAGLELESEIAKEREKFSAQLREVRESMEEAIKMKDEESTRDMMDLQKKYEDTLRRLELDREKLKISMQKLHEEKYAELTQRMQVQQAEHAQKMQFVEESHKKQHQALLLEFKKLQVVINAPPHKPPVKKKPPALLAEVFSPAGKVSKKPVWKVVLAISSQQYYLAGPGGAEKAVCSMPAAFKKREVKSPICIALGASGSWIASYYKSDDSPYLNVQGLDQYYPKLLEVLYNRDRELGVLEYVSLGSNGQYFARFEKGYHWSLDQDIINSEKLDETKSLIDHLALGINSTYVISRRDGYRNFRLKGYYKSVTQKLEELGSISGVKAIALDCSGTEYYVMLTTNNVLRMAANRSMVNLAKNWASTNFTSSKTS